MNKKITLILLIILSTNVYAQNCMYSNFGSIKWIKINIDNFKQKKLTKILKYKWLEDKKKTENRFSKCELNLEKGLDITYLKKGCKTTTVILTLLYDKKDVPYSKIINDLHQFTTIFMESDNDKILEVDEEILDKNKQKIDNGEILEIDTTPFDGFDKHTTSFQRTEGKFKVEIHTYATLYHTLISL